MCEMWAVAGLLLLLMWASVLCVWRCAGVRRARAVRACVLESRVRLRCCARAGVGWMMGCVVCLFTVLCCAAAADGKCALCGALRWRAARACCAWVCVGVARASAVLRARWCGLDGVLCCAPVCCAVECRLGWEGCAVGCGALWVVERLPGGVRRPLSPPDPVVGGPGSGHVVCAVCEAVGAAGAYVSVR